MYPSYSWETSNSRDSGEIHITQQNANANIVCVTSAQQTAAETTDATSRRNATNNSDVSRSYVFAGISLYGGLSSGEKCHRKNTIR